MTPSEMNMGAAEAAGSPEARLNALLDLVKDWMEAPVGKINDYDAKLIAAYFKMRPEDDT